MDLSIGLSGLKAASTRLTESAVTIARAGAGPSAAAASQQAANSAADNPVNSAGPQPSNKLAEARIGTQVADADLPAAMVEQLAASAAFMANAGTIKRTSEALESLLKTRE